MFFDIKKAFDFPLKEKDGILNIMVGGVITLIIQVLSQSFKIIDKTSLKNNPEIILIAIVLLIISMLISVFLSGYFVQSANNYINDRKPILGNWLNIYGLFLTGLKTVAISLVYILVPLAIVFGVGIFGTINLMKTNPGSLMYLFLLLIPIVIVLSIFCMFVSNAALLLFYKNLSLKDAFDFARIKILLSNNLFDIFILIVIPIAFIFGSSIISVLLCFTCIGAILIPFVGFWIQLAIVNIYAQFYKNVIEQNTEMV